MLKSFIYLLFITFMVAFTSCNNSNTKSGIPKVLRFGVSTRDEDPEDAMYRMQGMKKYLEKELGIEVEIYETTAYAAAIEALKTDKLDICSLGSFSYILATQTAGVEAISTRGTLDGKFEPYHSIIITWPGSNIKNIDDLKAKASQLTLAYGDPASTSGHLVPRAYLESIGLKNDKFKQVFFSNSHTATFFTVKSGKTDIGCVSESNVNKLIREGKIKRNEYVILWRSEPIINSAVCIRENLNPEFKLKVQKALADFRFKDPENWKLYSILIAKQTILPYDSLRFININDSSFNNLRAIARHYNLLDKK